MDPPYEDLVPREILLHDDLEAFERWRDTKNQNEILHLDTTISELEFLRHLHRMKAYRICAMILSVFGYSGGRELQDISFLSFVIKSVARHAPQDLYLVSSQIGTNIIPIRSLLLTEGYVESTVCITLSDIYYSLTIGQGVDTLRSDIRYTPGLSMVYLFSITPVLLSNIESNRPGIMSERIGALLLYDGTSRDLYFLRDDGEFYCFWPDWISRHHIDYGFDIGTIDRLYRDGISEPWNDVLERLGKLRLRPSEEFRGTIALAYHVMNKE